MLISRTAPVASPAACAPAKSREHLPLSAVPTIAGKFAAKGELKESKQRMPRRRRRRGTVGAPLAPPKLVSESESDPPCIWDVPGRGEKHAGLRALAADYLELNGGAASGLTLEGLILQLAPCRDLAWRNLSDVVSGTGPCCE